MFGVFDSLALWWLNRRFSFLDPTDAAKTESEDLDGVPITFHGSRV